MTRVPLSDGIAVTLVALAFAAFVVLGALGVGDLLSGRDGRLAHLFDPKNMRLTDDNGGH